MAHDVFLSYSTEDKNVVDSACAILEQRKMRCWVAPRDVLVGQGYAGQIASAIESAKVMVLIFSGHANRSQHVIREVEIAINHGIPIVPIRIDNVMPAGGLDYYLKTIHWLDALSPPLEEHLLELASRLEKLLGKQTVDAPPTNEPVSAQPRSDVQRKLGLKLLIAIASITLLVCSGVAIRTMFFSHPSRNMADSSASKPPSDEPHPSDLERLQGFWTLVASEVSGKRESIAEGDFEIEFRGDEMWTHESPHPPTSAKIILREEIDPRGLEQIFEYERDGKPFKGRISTIYRFLDEDHLELAFPSEDSFDHPSSLFPQGFDSTKEKINVGTFQRKH